MSGDGGNKDGPRGTKRMVDTPGPRGTVRLVERPDESPHHPVAAGGAPAPGRIEDEEEERKKDAEYKVLLRGQTVGQYRLGRPLGCGGYAEVREGVHKDGTIYALKALKPEHAAREVDAKRFTHEGVLLHRIRMIEGVVRVREVIAVPGIGAVIVMQRLWGLSLGQTLDRLPDKRIDWVIGLHIMARLAGTLAKVHAENVIHRDLSMGNIFLEAAPGKGEADPDRYLGIILDLGLAKSPDGPASTSSINGTCTYVSPEHLGRGELTSKSDIYSLACIIYEMFEGEHGYAYMDRAGDAGGLIAPRHVLYPVKMPEHIPVVIWNELIAPALEKNPDNRTATMIDVQTAALALASDLQAGKIDRRDLLPAAQSGSRARLPPKPLARLTIDDIPDVPPREVDMTADLKLPSLVVADGPVPRKRYEIGRSLLIGRWLAHEPRIGIGDITFPLDSISQHHCRMQIALEGVSASTYCVEDQQSANGTFVNGEKIKIDAILRPGGTLRLDEVTLRLYGPGTLEEQDKKRQTAGPNPARGATVPRGMSAPSIDPSAEASPSGAVIGAPAKTVMLVSIVFGTVGVGLVIVFLLVSLGVVPNFFVRHESPIEHGGPR